MLQAETSSPCSWTADNVLYQNISGYFYSRSQNLHIVLESLCPDEFSCRYYVHGSRRRPLPSTLWPPELFPHTRPVYLGLYSLVAGVDMRFDDQRRFPARLGIAEFIKGAFHIHIPFISRLYTAYRLLFLYARFYYTCLQRKNKGIWITRVRTCMNDF